MLIKLSVFTDVHLQVINVWSQPDFRWSQLINLSKQKMTSTKLALQS